MPIGRCSSTLSGQPQPDADRADEYRGTNWGVKRSGITHPPGILPRLIEFHQQESMTLMIVDQSRPVAANPQFLIGAGQATAY